MQKMVTWANGTKIVLAIGAVGVVIVAGLWWMTQYAREHTQPKENLLEFIAVERIGKGAKLVRSDLDWTGDSKPDFLFVVPVEKEEGKTPDKFNFKRLLLLSTPMRKPMQVLCIMDSMVLGKPDGFTIHVQPSGYGFEALVDRSGVPALSVAVIGKDSRPASDHLALRYIPARAQFEVVE